MCSIYKRLTLAKNILIILQWRSRLQVRKEGMDLWQLQALSNLWKVQDQGKIDMDRLSFFRNGELPTIKN